MSRTSKSPASPIGFAHRGAKAYAPENTIEAFQLALRLGATGLESDVWITRDGQAVLDHDGVVRRRGRRRPIGDVPRASLPDHVPTFGEMLEACPGTFHVSLDVKDPAAVDEVISTVRTVRPELEETLWLCHPRWETVASWRSKTTARLVDSTRLNRIKEGPERRLADLSSAGVDCLNMHHTDWTAGLVVLAHRFDRVAFGWDLQFDHVLESGVKMGLDGIFSDYPDRMVDVLRRSVVEPS